jgi:hypothetical protein
LVHLQYNFSQTAEAEEVVARHFAEWGPLEFVNYKSKYGCAFVRYRYRTSAEFAKVYFHFLSPFVLSSS